MPHMSPRTRLIPADRSASILAAALVHAQAVGYQNVTHDAIAAVAGVSPTLVSHYFRTMVQLKRDIMRHAIKNEVLPVIAQGLVATPRDPYASRVSDSLKARAMATLENT